MHNPAENPVFIFFLGLGTVGFTGYFIQAKPQTTFWLTIYASALVICLVISLIFYIASKKRALEILQEEYSTGLNGKLHLAFMFVLISSMLFVASVIRAIRLFT